eukprot:7244579-Alexandrium_andersonii.AAC.1
MPKVISWSALSTCSPSSARPPCSGTTWRNMATTRLLRTTERRARPRDGRDQILGREPLSLDPEI